MDGYSRDLTRQSTAALTEEAGKRERRESMFLSARLRLAEEAGVSDVRIRNLSPGGMMAELDRVVPIGTPIEVEMRGVGTITGRIAWCAERRVGVAFDSPIDPRLARVPVGGGTRTPVYAKPQLGR